MNGKHNVGRKKINIMKVIYNNVIPCKGYKAINLFGVFFVRKGATISEQDINHEAIHTAQMREILYILFYVWYFVEWIVRIFQYKNVHKAYRNISFEREAYTNDCYLLYLQDRKHYTWMQYLRT